VLYPPSASTIRSNFAGGGGKKKKVKGKGVAPYSSSLLVFGEGGAGLTLNHLLLRATAPEEGLTEAILLHPSFRYD